tara:strand:- start:67 stop:282 length:216 start_codon:yes stop_codon:yes gene_type:complete
MKILKYINMENFNAWSGAKHTLKTIKDHNKIKELELLLEQEFFEKPPTETQINDLLWFEDQYIFEQLNIKE